MSVLRLFAIGLIWVCATAAWMVLGASVVSRTGESDARLNQEVSSLWGGVQTQHAPSVEWIETRSVEETVSKDRGDGTFVSAVTTRTEEVPVRASLASGEVRCDLHAEHRQKGLLWFPTYSVAFRGEYGVLNETDEPKRARVTFRYPSTSAIYDDFRFTVDGMPVEGVGSAEGILSTVVSVPAGQTARVRIEYRSRGLDSWTYRFGDGIERVQNFALVMHAPFRGFDFPAGSMSPSKRTPTDDGEILEWRFRSLVAGQSIALSMPTKLNPGPLVSRISFFAPVSLLFFFAVVVVLGLLRGVSLHPMHYAFLSAAFFAFHLLLAYLVDQLSIHGSFVIAAAVSVALVMSYLWRVAGARFAILEAGIAQLIYLVLFSYSFFFEGKTGLTVTLGAVATLAVLMHATARVDWAGALVAPTKAGAR